jgi:hypothetical protein
MAGGWRAGKSPNQVGVGASRDEARWPGQGLEFGSLSDRLQNHPDWGMWRSLLHRSSPEIVNALARRRLHDRDLVCKGLPDKGLREDCVCVRPASWLACNPYHRTRGRECAPGACRVGRYWSGPETLWQFAAKGVKAG